MLFCLILYNRNIQFYLVMFFYVCLEEPIFHKGPKLKSWELRWAHTGLTDSHDLLNESLGHHDLDKKYTVHWVTGSGQVRIGLKHANMTSAVKNNRKCGGSFYLHLKLRNSQQKCCHLRYSNCKLSFPHQTLAWWLSSVNELFYKANTGDICLHWVKYHRSLCEWAVIIENITSELMALK